MNLQINNDYVLFDLADYVDNPVAVARINAGMTQQELAAEMNLKKTDIAKIENQAKVSAKILKKVKEAIQNK